MTDLTTLGSEDLERTLEQHRVELTGYCYRMLGSSSDAEDAVQDTLVRAWRGYDRFEGRSALRSWLYRIATNVCFDMLNGKQRRARPMDFGPAKTADAALAPRRRKPPGSNRCRTAGCSRPRVTPRTSPSPERRSGSRSSPRCSTSRPASARC